MKEKRVRDREEEERRDRGKRGIKKGKRRSRGENEKKLGRDSKEEG